MFTIDNFNNEGLFWDDCVQSILDQINLGVYEISKTHACEMNTPQEYIFAQKICSEYYQSCEHFISDGTGSLKSPYDIECVHDPETCKMWQTRLLNHIGFASGHSKYEYSQPLTQVFDKGEYPFMVRDKVTNSYIAYIDIAENSNYILLRRIYIDEKNRRHGLGTEIVNFIKLYAKLTGKEMRVNVYDKSAEKFYLSIGMKLYFKTYRI